MSLRTLAVALVATLLSVPLAAQTTLYEQPSAGLASGTGTVANDTQGWTYSENYTVPANDGNDGYLADDFVVPEDTTWSIDEVSVVSFYAGGATLQKATDFNVIIWSHDDANGTPDAEVYRADNISPTTDGTGGALGAGIITFSLDSPARINDGRYWLTVQANSPVTAPEGGDTRYYWRSDATPIGDSLKYWNYGGALAGAAPCVVDWGTNSPVCGGRVRNSNEPSVYFKLAGAEWNVASEEAAESRTVSILPTRPNPAVGRTLIPFTLREPADVRLAVYDALGREVALVADRGYGAGEHAETLDTAGLAPGTYVVRLAAGADVVLRTISVLR